MKLKKLLKRMLFDERIQLYWAKEKAEKFYDGWAGELRDFHKETLNLKIVAITRSKEATRLIVTKGEN